MSDRRYRLIPLELVTFLLTIAAIIGITYVVYTLPVVTEVSTVSEARHLARDCDGEVSIETVYDGYTPVLWRVKCTKQP